MLNMPGKIRFTRQASVSVIKMPNCAAAPNNSSLGLASSGPKSIIAPMPMNSSNGNSSLEMPARNSSLRAPTSMRQLMHLVDGAGKRQVDKDGAEAHGQQQAGLHVLLDSQIDQSAADGPHHDHFNGRNGIKRQDASKHRIDKIHEYFHLRFLSPFQRFGISPI